MTGGEKGKLQLVAIKAEHEAHPLRFFGWVLFLSIPFYVWGVLWPIELPLGLPVSATMIIAPALMATVMTCATRGTALPQNFGAALAMSAGRRASGGR